MKKVAEAGELGDMYLAKPHAVRRRAVPTWGVFLNEEEQGGGPLIDIGTHALDMTLWIMDNYKPKYAVGTTYKKLNDQTDTANAFGDWDPKEFTVEDSAFGFVVMENGATIILETSWALNTLDVGEVRTDDLRYFRGNRQLGRCEDQPSSRRQNDGRTPGSRNGRRRVL